VVLYDLFRRFTHNHLAQLKFILPEAIDIKKILMFDERTSCMKPDLHVTINPDAVEFDAKLKSESGNMCLRKLFRERLKDFWKSHPEVWLIYSEAILIDIISLCL
jgi:chromatin licensing and DNA replication factor 1